MKESSWYILFGSLFFLTFSKYSNFKNTLTLIEISIYIVYEITNTRRYKESFENHESTLTRASSQDLHRSLACRAETVWWEKRVSYLWSLWHALNLSSDDLSSFKRTRKCRTDYPKKTMKGTDCSDESWNKVSDLSVFWLLIIP